MDKNIKNILLSELSNINYAKIILFGSRARGNYIYQHQKKCKQH